MKKLYPIFLMLAVMLGSCSGDDSSNEVQNNNPDPVTPVVTDSTATDTTNTPTNTVKLLKITSTYTNDPSWDNTVSYTYDGEKLISEHTIGGDGVNFKLEYVYDGNKIHHVNKYDNGNLDTVYSFTYTGDNITQIQSVHSTFTMYNSTYTYTYNQNNQIIGGTMYNESGVVSVDPYTCTWSDSGNLINTSSAGTGNQASYTFYEYDSKINPLKNYTFCYPEVNIRNLSNNNLEILGRSNSDFVREWEYQYNELGYPIWAQTHTSTGTEITYEYFYTED